MSTSSCIFFLLLLLLPFFSLFNFARHPTMINMINGSPLIRTALVCRSMKMMDNGCVEITFVYMTNTLYFLVAQEPLEYSKQAPILITKVSKIQTPIMESIIIALLYFKTVQ